MNSLLLEFVNQTTVYVELSGPEMKFDEVNPQMKKETVDWNSRKKDGKKPVTVQPRYFLCLMKKD